MRILPIGFRDEPGGHGWPEQHDETKTHEWVGRDRGARSPSRSEVNRQMRHDGSYEPSRGGGSGRSAFRASSGSGGVPGEKSPCPCGAWTQCHIGDALQRSKLIVGARRMTSIKTKLRQFVTAIFAAFKKSRFRRILAAIFAAFTIFLVSAPAAA